MGCQSERTGKAKFKVGYSCARQYNARKCNISTERRATGSRG